MKKIISKVRKIKLIIFLTIVGMQNKVLGYTSTSQYGWKQKTNTLPSQYVVQPAYGVPSINMKTMVIIRRVCEILSIIVIPIVMITGLIVYLNKSKSSFKKKILISILVIIFIIVQFFILSYICDYLKNL